MHDLYKKMELFGGVDETGKLWEIRPRTFTEVLRETDLVELADWIARELGWIKRDRDVAGSPGKLDHDAGEQLDHDAGEQLDHDAGELERDAGEQLERDAGVPGKSDRFCAPTPGEILMTLKLSRCEKLLAEALGKLERDAGELERDADAPMELERDAGELDWDPSTTRKVIALVLTILEIESWKG
jgi:hypothetical protein